MAGHGGWDHVTGLSHSAIVRAAREIIAEVGVDGLTMRRLSTKLGVALGATYYYVPNKHALVVLVAQDLYDEVDFPSAQDGDWAEQVKQLTMNMTRVVCEYPGMANYIMTHIDDMIPMRLSQAMLSILRDAGFTDESSHVVMSSLYFYGTGMSVNVDQIRAARSFERASMETLYVDGLDLLLAGARLRLAEDVALRTR